MSAHLGHAVTAFIDGELDHTRRDEVLAHLTHCDGCRAEVEALRRLKAALRLEPTAVPMDLAARLLSAPAVPLPEARPHRRRRSSEHARLRRTAMGGALVALGLGGALSLAGPPPSGPVAPLDPTNAGFVRDHGATSNEVPFTELDVVSVSSTRSPAPAP
ncbi:MAG: putative transrane anti-sigma factor [Frankiales bacterium]|nr:putative transrane anti-sigma factor [Frankiales bacterium]